ncbi:hypothetical protein L1049_011569 [Liquidambar formosana]|uniref:Uncharacterized protein n=1 Tax=Liquidambar formosana TaxID=63359 RepID=A0AAP0X315_LIQFO
MEETIPLIIQGCQLAKVLESNLPNLANQPDVLSKSCDDIIRLFINAKERLNHPDPTSSYPPAHMLLFREQQESSQIHTGIQDWLRSSYTQLLADKGAFGMQAGLPEIRAGVDLGARDREGSSRSRGSGGEFQGAAASDSARCSSSQRPRRR